jgi:hypothetical protein
LALVAVTTETLLGVAMPSIVGVCGTSSGGLEPPGGLPEVTGVDPPEPLHADNNVTNVTAASALLILKASRVIRELPDVCASINGEERPGSGNLQ